jgi:hypothetical protein
MTQACADTALSLASFGTQFARAIMMHATGEPARQLSSIERHSPDAVEPLLAGRRSFLAQAQRAAAVLDTDDADGAIRRAKTAPHPRSSVGR